VPEGSGPFPAVVHLHSCEPVPARDDAWVVSTGTEVSAIVGFQNSRLWRVGGFW
jgi:hypothetical protein